MGGDVTASGQRKEHPGPEGSKFVMEHGPSRRTIKLQLHRPVGWSCAGSY